MKGMNPLAFAFPSEAGPYLPIREGWQAELA